jgi:anthranilate synthase
LRPDHQDPEMISSHAYPTAGGLRVTRSVAELPFEAALDDVMRALDTRRGALFGSSYDYPGRYKRWSMGFVDPPLELTATGYEFAVSALNRRGEVLVPAVGAALASCPELDVAERTAQRITGRIKPGSAPFDETQRTRQPSIFSAIRAVIAHFASPEDHHLGLYGAFGYDLVFQLEPIPGRRQRPPDQRDLVLYLPDELVIVDHQLRRALRVGYEIATDAGTTAGLPRDGARFDHLGARREPASRADMPPGGYADIVRQMMPKFRRGDLFEVVPGQSFYEPCEAAPSVLFETLRRVNPSPYGFLLNLGGEYLVGASPEMFVRVEERRVETCPISGTIARGADAIEDAERIRTLLNSAKDEAELTMCTDVDRNDKARVCEPGSVRVIGRRQIELYSHLIHTVDHVEGQLAPGFDALDAFLTHAWAVTVTGAPKRAAIRTIEAVETSPRRWYGGAVGCLGFDGSANTGLTLRTIQLRDGIAEIRVGATLLADSIPEEEERETHTKAAALFRTLQLVGEARGGAAAAAAPAREERRVLLVDCEDSFVHMLGGYFRAEGARLAVLRHDVARPAIAAGAWDLVVLSPGPGRPDEFAVPAMVRACVDAGLPVFGVCLGLQGIVEAFGGELGVLPEPQHGKTAQVRVVTPGAGLFEGVPERFAAGRYHSLYALRLPHVLRATAYSQDDIVMAIEHESLPVAAVQFHPESIMTLGGEAGRRIVRNALLRLRADQRSAAAVAVAGRSLRR